MQFVLETNDSRSKDEFNSNLLQWFVAKLSQNSSLCLAELVLFSIPIGQPDPTIWISILQAKQSCTSKAKLVRLSKQVPKKFLDLILTHKKSRKAQKGHKQSLLGKNAYTTYVLNTGSFLHKHMLIPHFSWYKHMIIRPMSQLHKHIFLNGTAY